jgi:glycosyltransferase involved in cell wall biosynthesis
MRVLAVGNMYPPHHLGGYELVWASAMHHLRDHGHTVRVLTTDFRTTSRAPDRDEVFRELRWYWRDHAWPRLRWHERLALERHNHRTLTRHLSELQPDVVTWWAMGGMSLSLIERVRREQLPAVGFVHDDWLAYGPRVDQWVRVFGSRPRAGAIVERLSGVPTRIELDQAARYVFVSETVLAHARAEGLKLGGSTIAPSGIDPRFFVPPRDVGWGWRLLYVGRIDERKGVSDAVASLAELPGQAELTIAGDGDPSELERLRALAAELGIDDRVHTTGMRSRSELAELYTEADALLFPVRWDEPWGLVPLEAMAAGCVVVATGHGGSGEYLRDGGNGLLVPAGDPPAIARALYRLSEDAELRERLRQGGAVTARQHTEEAFNQAALEAIISAVGAREAFAQAT